MAGVVERLRCRLREKGRLSCAEFMEEALYGEGGYYAGPRPAIGREGDFVTGSSLTPLFGQATARLLARLDDVLGRPADLLEVGCGSGEHLAAVLKADGRAERRVMAWDRVRRPLPEGVRPLPSLEAVSERSVHGLVFSYELFDALPVHRLVGRREGPPGELWVELAPGGELRWVEGELSDPDLARLPGADLLEPGQIADLTPAWGELYGSLAARLAAGLLVTCDYGFERHRLLDGRARRHGTLACYRRHRVHRNPFAQPGEEDLTAHVDLTALVEAGEARGLSTWALTRQAAWLGGCGLFDGLERAAPAIRLDAATLLDPGGMGVEIRVLVQKRKVDVEPLFDLDLREF